mmetsp:Transcript_1766/g.4067  ORF Transcript_1766/g.4067 Transcript_1766/m.4067 type:complete len:687 (-) Transcript_1766:41-2101(-)
MTMEIEHNNQRTINSTQQVVEVEVVEGEEEEEDHDEMVRRDRNDDTDDDGGDDESASSSMSVSSSSSSYSDRAIGVTESELQYSIESFGAVFLPVSITMTLSALAVIFINTPESIAAGEQAYAQVYQVFNVDSESQTTVQTLGASVANTLIIVTAIGVMTFVVVLLYKYRCLKILYGYLFLATAMLLGYFTSNMLIMFIQIYGWWGRGMDKVSLGLIMYNYAAVGVVAIFYGKGLPRWLAQGYLITSSVCVAWQLSYFDDWMAWTLLVMLALYDLFAVLSPCGPLKALAKMISEKGAPTLPGLLYEASLPAGVARPKRKKKNNEEEEEDDGDDDEPSTTSAEEQANSNASGDDNTSSNRRTEPYDASQQDGVVSTSVPRPPPVVSERENQFDDEHNERYETTRTASQVSISTPTYDTAVSRSQARSIGRDGQIRSHGSSSRRDSNVVTENLVTIEGVPSDIDTSNTAKIPLALAKMYKLSIIDEKGGLRTSRFASTWQRYYTAEEIRGSAGGEPVLWTSKQLRSEIVAIMPPRGGRIEKCQGDDQKYDEGVAYHVYNRHGDVQRKLVVTKDGQVMEVLKRSRRNNDGSEGSEYDDDAPGSIKLGLGDFIFYSVLVSKAAQHSFTAFAACFLMVLFGLSLTLIILAVYGKALPALPISILLAVVTFLWCRWSYEPFIFSVLDESHYV